MSWAPLNNVSDVNELLGEIQRLRQAVQHPEINRVPRRPPTFSDSSNGPVNSVGSGDSDDDGSSLAVDDDHSSALTAGVATNQRRVISQSPSNCDGLRASLIQPGEDRERADSTRNPFINDRQWFFPLTPEMPIRIGEAAKHDYVTCIDKMVYLFNHFS